MEAVLTFADAMLTVGRCNRKSGGKSPPCVEAALAITNALLAAGAL